MKRKQDVNLCIISGLLTGITFSVTSLSPFLFISIVPFIISLYSGFKDGNIRKTFAKSMSFFFSFDFCIYYWFIALYPLDFAGLNKTESIVVVALGWIGISFVQALVSSGIMCLVNLVKNKSVLSFGINFSLLFVLGEFVLSLGTFGFPWNRLETAIYKMLPFLQMSSVLGPYFIDFLIVIINSLFAISILSKKYVKYITFAVLIFACNFAMGLFIMSEDCKPVNTAKVLIAQGNILSGEKWSGKKNIFDTYVGLTENEKFDIALWPETATATDITIDERKLDKIKSFLGDGELITGTFLFEDNGDYNAAVLINKNGVTDSKYRKIHVVPFGEYMPYKRVLEKIFPSLCDINMFSDDLSKGDEYALLESEKGPIASLVCFDSIFEGTARNLVKNGGQLITVVTNDSWYKDYPAVYQHNAQSVLRAVENHRYVIRSANSGVSSIISPNGNIIKIKAPLVKGTILSDVDFYDDITLYTKYGNVIVPVFAICFILLCVLSKKVRS